MDSGRKHSIQQCGNQAAAVLDELRVHPRDVELPQIKTAAGMFPEPGEHGQNLAPVGALSSAMSGERDSHSRNAGKGEIWGGGGKGARERSIARVHFRSLAPHAVE